MPRISWKQAYQDEVQRSAALGEQIARLNRHLREAEARIKEFEADLAVARGMLKAETIRADQCAATLRRTLLERR